MNNSKRVLKKLSPDEKTFLDRVSFRLFSNPLKWRQLIKEGMTYDELFKYYVDLTNQKKEKKDGEKAIQEK